MVERSSASTWALRCGCGWGAESQASGWCAARTGTACRTGASWCVAREPSLPWAWGWTMPAELARKWVALVLGAVVLSTGCITVTPPAGRGALLDRNPRAAPGLAGDVRGEAQYALTGSNA